MQCAFAAWGRFCGLFQARFLEMIGPILEALPMPRAGKQVLFGAQAPLLAT